MRSRQVSTRTSEAQSLIDRERRGIQATLLLRLAHLSGKEIQLALRWCLAQPCSLHDLETLQRLIAQAELE